MKKAVHAFISGRVQGVWYRASTQQKAQQLGLTGWVRNLSDGRVELMAEGDEEKLNALLKWCEQGPENAVVQNIENRWIAAVGDFVSFEKRSTV